MGDLKGHALPGSLFLLFGLWWAVSCLRRYFMCRKANKKYISTATFTCPCSCGKFGALPVESIGKIVLSSVGMFGEITFNLPHPSMGIIQHATMYFFFLVSGLVDLAMHFGVALPAGTDYVSILLAFFVEGLLFANHLHEREILDVKIHILLVYVVFLTVILIGIEAKYRRSPILTMARAYLVMLQGSWFWAVGIMLYGHGKDSTAWDLNSHMDVMQATIYFSWHCAFHFILLVVLAIIMSRCYRGSGGSFRNGGSELPMTRLDNGGSESSYRMLSAFEDEEGSDIEFEKPVDKSLLPS